MTSTTQHAVRPSILATSLTGLAILVAVWVAGLSIAASAGFSRAELHVVAWVGSPHSPFLDALARTIDVVIGPFVAPLLGLLLVVAALIVARTWRAALRAAVLLAVPWGIAEAMKYAVQRPRPDIRALTRTIPPDTFTSSFPSGHAAFAAALTCAVILCLTAPRTATRTAVIVIGALFTLAVAWSRVYLGVHYPTDVLASIILIPAIAIPLDRITRRMPVLAISHR
ncbi:phosphatase PAP2 family protein [Microbacterium kribbense]|uniref:Phosphatase PAP2 family protein n=1 Tax=Microbacterium kribbense TaxID=433645 RepID=A0ABP7GF12_9MICO